MKHRIESSSQRSLKLEILVPKTFKMHVQSIEKYSKSIVLWYNYSKKKKVKNHIKLIFNWSVFIKKFANFVLARLKKIKISFFDWKYLENEIFVQILLKKSIFSKENNVPNYFFAEHSFKIMIFFSKTNGKTLKIEVFDVRIRKLTFSFRNCLKLTFFQTKFLIFLLKTFKIYVYSTKSLESRCDFESFNFGIIY